MRARGFALLLTVSLGAVLVAGCAQHTPDAAPPSKPAAGFPATVSVVPGQSVTLKTEPHRIVSLDPTTTESLYAIGAGKQVVAVDGLSDYPQGTPKTSLSGLSPNTEAIARYRPDLVIASTDANGLFANLGKLHIPALRIGAPKTLDDAYAQITALGRATGHSTAATATVNRMRTRIDAAVHGTPRPHGTVSYYYELDPTLYTVTSKTFIGSIFARFGLQNVADSADPTATAAAGGYPQLSAEKVVAANPDIIFLADTQCCGQSAQTVAKRPGWAGLTAVRGGGVASVPDSVASRWGPRLVDLVQAIANAVRSAEKHG